VVADRRAAAMIADGHAATVAITGGGFVTGGDGASAE
jgi:hypothetical protein